MTNPLTSQWPRQTTWPHLHSARVGLKQHIQAPLHSTAGCQRNMKGAGRWCSGEVRSFWVGGPGWAGWNPGGEPPHHCFSHSGAGVRGRSEEHTSELQSRQYLVCRLLLEKKKRNAVTCRDIHT